MQKGQSLIELILTIALVSIFFPALLTGFVSTRSNRAVTDQRQLANAYLNEAQEAIRVVRANGWSNLSTGTYHPIVSGSTWILTSGPEPIDGNFTRQIIIEEVKRDSDGNIAQDGTLDPSTKLITISVSWNSPFPNSVSAKSYLTRHDSNIHTDTTIADFSGIKNGTAVTETSGTNVPDDGQIQLGSRIIGNWCNPTQTAIVTYNLPGQGITTDITAVVGHAYTTTGGNASGNSMDSVNISDTSPPNLPVVTNGGSYNNYKTYGIYSDSGYTYLASDHPNLTVDIVRTSSQPYTQTGTFDASGGEEGKSVYAASTTLGYTGFVTAESKLYSFDLNSKSGSRPQYGSATLSGTGNRIIVVGNYAYIATSNTISQLQIFNISNPKNMTLVKSFDVKNGQPGADVFVSSSGTYAYFVTNYISGKPNFFLISVADPSNPVILGSSSTNGMNPKGVIAVSGNHAIVVGSGGQQYQVFTVNNGTLSYCGGMSPANITSINAIAAVSESDGDNYSYILTDDANKEFQIIQGGPGGVSTPTGTYESTVFDAGGDVLLNGFAVNHLVPVATNIEYYVSIAKAINNSCSGVTFSYAGPFATSSALPISIGSEEYQNPGRCMKYKVNLSTSDPTQTPILYDISLNYSL